jgi:phosphoribosylaminoimidazolecarboxamide formyltransferase/IMP cyclohydrolase
LPLATLTVAKEKIGKMIRNALISVADKKGIAEFAKEISNLGTRIISTGNTAKILAQCKIPFRRASEITGFDEMLNGRVKSLHPKIFGGILAERKKRRHLSELKRLRIEAIDMVVVNFYPFEEAAKNSLKIGKLVEYIDIGGPALVRAAAKNFQDVIVIVDNNDYKFIIEKIKRGNISYDDRINLACKAFSYTARYESIINGHFNKLTGNEFPDILNLTLKKIQDLRYGENPHQRASFYKDLIAGKSSVSLSKQLQGKELSFNNILDVDAAFELVKEFDKPTAAVIKHTNPCGVASSNTIDMAYKKAHEADTKSSFGSIVALNRNCNAEIATIIKNLFVEVVICPKFDRDSIKILKEKKNLRLLEAGAIRKSGIGYDLKKVADGILMQDNYFPVLKKNNLKIVTKRKPVREELDDMLFAWKVNKHVKSNSIVLAKDEITSGIGAGQMSRVDAVQLAVWKSEGKSRNSVMSSDAFFPFRDGVDEAAKGGIKAIIQPGGSIRDKEVIDAADEHGMAMVFTGVRLFRH